MSKIIPYLASKFTENQFKRMQINLFIDQKTWNWDINDLDLDKFTGIQPKHIQISTVEKC